jgi:hypothetical protein
MTVFAVMARTNRPDIAEAVERVYPNGKSFRFGDNVWFVSDRRTAKAVSDALGVKKGGITGVVVMPTTGAYYGVANTTLWDWLRSALEEGADG